MTLKRSLLAGLMLAVALGIGFHVRETAVRAQASETPILVLAGREERSVAAEAVREGAQDYFIKGSPEWVLLKRAIRYAIEIKSASREVERLLDADAVAKMVVDAAGALLYANPAAEALLGFKQESQRGRPLAYPLTPDAPSRITISSPGSADRSLDVTTGSISWNGAQARLISLPDCDSGRLRLLEEEARENMRVVEIKNQFMGRISHELRNTLATVKTAVFCLNDRLAGELTPRQSRLVEMISRNVDRQVKIIDNVLDLARLQSGKIKIVPRPVELAQIVDEITQEFSMRNKPQRLVLDFPVALPAVNGDADLLVQVLRNLLDNAFRYARSRVTIKAADAGPEEVSLSIVDDGEGIPQDRIGALFNQFVQFDRPKGGNGYKGTGLGLAICKEIIEGHRGRIWVESAKGEGTSFHFALTKYVAPESAVDGAVRALEPVVRAAADHDFNGFAGPSHRVQK